MSPRPPVGYLPPFLSLSLRQLFVCALKTNFSGAGQLSWARHRHSIPQLSSLSGLRTLSAPASSAARLSASLPRGGFFSSCFSFSAFPVGASSVEGRRTQRKSVIRLEQTQIKMASPFTGGLPVWDETLLSAQFANLSTSPAPTSNAGAPASESAPASASGKEKGARDDGKKASGGFTPLYESIVRGEKWSTPKPSSLSLEEKYELCLSIAQECIQPEELRALLEKKPFPLCYDGFEPSGRMHVAQGLLKVTNVNKLTRAGCVFVFWVADWFAMLNNKMGGDLKKIQKVGEYFIEVWKAAGMDMQNVRFLWASEEINRNSDQYWMQVMQIARSFTITRIKRCSQIMGRQEGDDQPAAQILYPCMQCADIFYLGADICQLGMDQRKVNMLAREYCDEIKRKLKPIILSHQMLPGLLEGQEKMSKSNPDSAIFMEDTEVKVNRKIKKAFCPPGVIEGNPCAAYVEKLVFAAFGEFTVKRSEANGGDIVYKSVEEFRNAYISGDLHPGDLKESLARELNRRLDPIRKHFTENEHAKQLLQQIKAYKVTK